jgi:hypothetical protein
MDKGATLVSARFTGGGEIEIAVPHASGSPQRRLSDDDLDEKLRASSVGVLPHDVTETLCGVLANLERATDLAVVAELSARSA